jgi:hypothetical protein
MVLIQLGYQGAAGPDIADLVRSLGEIGILGRRLRRPAGVTIPATEYASGERHKR